MSHDEMIGKIDRLEAEVVAIMRKLGRQAFGIGLVMAALGTGVGYLVNPETVGNIVLFNIGLGLLVYGVAEWQYRRRSAER